MTKPGGHMRTGGGVVVCGVVVCGVVWRGVAWCGTKKRGKARACSMARRGVLNTSTSQASPQSRATPRMAADGDEYMLPSTQGNVKAPGTVRAER